MEHFYIKSDKDYRQAINYDNTNYYNYPCTFNFGDKKYIIGAGSSDHITVTRKDNCFYVIAENFGLGYISMAYIDTKYDIVHECFLQGDDITDPDCFSYNVLDKDTEEQITILSEYIDF